MGEPPTGRDSGNPPPSRRLFFAEGMRRLFETVDRVSAKSRGWLPKVAPGGSPSRRAPLRPPGALPEAELRGTCERSGRCVAACPVHAIQPMRSADPALHGTPYIVAMQQACVVCDDLSCMKACPSGALHLVAKEQIAMGTAHVDLATCVRSRSEPCRECVDRCPIGESALAFDARGRVDVRSGCVGCGVCEQHCPTSPRAITIVPRGASPSERASG